MPGSEPLDWPTAYLDECRIRRIMLSWREDNCGKRVVFPNPIQLSARPTATTPRAFHETDPETFEQYWEIDYQGRSYPWRPVHAEDELDLPRLMRGAMAYLQGDLRRHG